MRIPQPIPAIAPKEPPPRDRRQRRLPPAANHKHSNFERRRVLQSDGLQKRREGWTKVRTPEQPLQTIFSPSSNDPHQEFVATVTPPATAGTLSSPARELAGCLHRALRLPAKNLLTGTKSRILRFRIDTGCRGHPCRGSVKPAMGFTFNSARFSPSDHGFPRLNSP
jgi:hypothetical protein